MSGIGAQKAINWKKNLTFIWLSQFLAMIGFGCCMPFIPLLIKENLHIEDEHLRGLYVSLYYLAGMTSLCIATAVWGMLADRFGRKIMLLRASYAAAIFYPMLALMPNFWSLVLVRFVCSFFSGTVNPAQTLLVSTTPKEKHGFVLGTMSTAIWSGNMVGYLTGGLMVHYFGYATAFATCGVIYLISALLIQFFADENFQRLPKSAVAKQPKHRFRDLATPGVTWLLAMFLIMGVARRIEEPFVAMLVETVHGEGEAAFFTGIISAVAAFGGVLAGMLIGHFCDKFKPSSLLLPIILASIAATTAQAASTSIAMLIAARFAAYLFAGGLQPVLQVMLSKITDEKLRGTFFGWSASVNTAGGIICSFISSPIAFYIGVRGIFYSAAIIMATMLLCLIPTIHACNREEKLQ